MTAIVLDTETTGTDKFIDRVIEVGIVRWDNGAEVALHRINPGVPIKPEVTVIHGISDDDVRECPPFSFFAEELKTLIESSEAVIGYNPFFDHDMLNAEFSRLSITVRWPAIICAKRVWDIYEPREERHLQNAYRRFVNESGFQNAHSALADVHATRDVLMSQIKLYGLEDVPLQLIDPESRFWWGPTHHILLTDGGDIVINFGKNKGKLVSDVDTGYWRWIISKDFPDHVTLIALKMMDINKLPVSEQRNAITMWAITHKAEKMS